MLPEDLKALVETQEIKDDLCKIFAVSVSFKVGIKNK